MDTDKMNCIILCIHLQFNNNKTNNPGCTIWEENIMRNMGMEKHFRLKLNQQWITTYCFVLYCDEAKSYRISPAEVAY